jgi:hypothetical protein
LYLRLRRFEDAGRVVERLRSLDGVLAERLLQQSLALRGV